MQKCYRHLTLIHWQSFAAELDDLAATFKLKYILRLLHGHDWPHLPFFRVMIYKIIDDLSVFNRSIYRIEYDINCCIVTK